MDRFTTWGAPGLAILALAGLAYSLLAHDGVHRGQSWVDLTTAVLFVAVAWLYAAALVRRASTEAASVLLWWTVAATLLFWVFAN